MAMYENRGYCPNNAFLHYGMDEANNVSKLWTKANDIIGDRAAYMVYPESCNAYKSGCYIVDALEGATGTLGIEVATALKQMIPVCKYSEMGRPIICKDLINPYQIPVQLGKTEKKWALCDEERSEKTLLFEDERYLIVMQDNDQDVRIYIYKK